MKNSVHAVETPEHLTVDAIKEKYWDNYVLVTNTKKGGTAGIVRYFSYANEPELTSLIMEMDKDEETYGECLIYYVGPGRGFLGVYV